MTPSMPRPKRPAPEPLDCDPILLSDLEVVVKQVLLSPKPDGQHSENREPTQEEREQKFKLERRV